jgi:hypothetical protein
MSLDSDPNLVDFIDDCSNPKKVEKIESILDEHLTTNDLEALADKLLNITDISQTYRELGHTDSEIYEDLRNEIKDKLCKVSSVELDIFISSYKSSKKIVKIIKTKYLISKKLKRRSKKKRKTRK